MPDMTGPEMIRTLPAAHAHVPVLFVTGYAGDIAESSEFGGHEVLRKPYTLMGLSHALSNALSGSRHPGTAAAAE
jgi:CheY-like chemotaxis protein